MPNDELQINNDPDPVVLRVVDDDPVQMSPEEARIIEAISPKVTVERVDDGVQITSTDVNGTTTAKVNDGPAGASGPQGPQGEQGTEGPPGSSGVYVGDSEPTDPGVNVWIDPTGQGSQVITDVQVNGTSVLSNGVANVPKATLTSVGVVKPHSAYGIGIFTSDGSLRILKPTDNELKNSTDINRPISPGFQHKSTFYGLAKAAGDTSQPQSDNDVGNYTPQAKGAIQGMLGVTDLIGLDESNLTASKAYAVGDCFLINGRLYKAVSPIAKDGNIVLDGANSNCANITIGDDFVKRTDLDKWEYINTITSGNEDLDVLMCRSYANGDPLRLKAAAIIVYSAVSSLVTGNVNMGIGMVPKDNVTGTSSTYEFVTISAGIRTSAQKNAAYVSVLGVIPDMRSDTISPVEGAKTTLFVGGTSDSVFKRGAIESTLSSDGLIHGIYAQGKYFGPGSFMRVYGVRA